MDFEFVKQKLPRESVAEKRRVLPLVLIIGGFFGTFRVHIKSPKNK
jgi:hypothetical protein